MGMLWMTPAGRLNDLPRAASRTHEALPERHITHGTNMFTLLDDAVWGFSGAVEEGCIGNSDRERPAAGLHHAGGGLLSWHGS